MRRDFKISEELVKLNNIIRDEKSKTINLCVDNFTPINSIHKSMVDYILDTRKLHFDYVIELLSIDSEDLLNCNIKKDRLTLLLINDNILNKHDANYCLDLFKSELLFTRESLLFAFLKNIHTKYRIKEILSTIDKNSKQYGNLQQFCLEYYNRDNYLITLLDLEYLLNTNMVYVGDVDGIIDTNDINDIRLVLDKSICDVVDLEYEDILKMDFFEKLPNEVKKDYYEKIIAVLNDTDLDYVVSVSHFIEEYKDMLLEVFTEVELSN